MSASRAVAVGSELDAAGPQNLLQVLEQINHHLGNIQDGLGNTSGHLESILKVWTATLKIQLAQTSNHRIVRHNTRLEAPLQLLPLQKTVPGYGCNLAIPFIAVLDAAGQQNFHAKFPPGGNAALIGSTPPNFIARLDAYGHLDICEMMVFYNETFGIFPQDDLSERVTKFHVFLTE